MYELVREFPRPTLAEFEPAGPITARQMWRRLESHPVPDVTLTYHRHDDGVRQNENKYYKYQTKRHRV